MSETRQQIDALRELHGDTAATVRALLDHALEHDTAARELRRQAGQALARLRAEKPETWLHDAGIDHDTAELLLAMGSGRG